MRDITERVQAEKQLWEKEEQYRSIFEATTDGLIISNLRGLIIEANPAACRMYGYAYEESVGLSGTDITSPDAHFLLTEALQTIRTDGRSLSPIRATGVRKDGTTFPTEGYGTTIMYKGKPHILAVVRDITEQVRVEEQLREKEEQYRSIFEATNDGLNILDPDGFIVEANPAFCRMFGYTREELIGLEAGKLTAPLSRHLVEESRESIKEGRDIQVEGLALRKDRGIFHAEAHLTALIYQGKPHMLGVTRDITEQVQAQQLLEQRVEERTRELSTLLEVSHNVASTIELKPLLDLILDQLKAVVNYTGSSLTIVDHEDLVLVGTRGPESEEHLIQRRFSLKHFGLIWEMVCRREPVIIDDVRDDAPLAQAYREAVGELLQTTLHYIHSWIGVPLIVKERVIGLLAASHSESNYYKPHHATLAMAIANQAAIAIENAHLYEQAQELAAVEERQRLARELHDSVSQALYGISLGVHTARLQLDQNPRELAESLDYVLELAEAALTEMRALIFELRPESLEAEGLVTALTRQAAAMHARHGIKVELDLCNEPDVSLKVKRELYRVAQEALHNTVKHAEASKVDLRLRLVDGEVMLEVHDNGKGFEATGSFPGHLGLHSMRERIESLDGGLQIESAPDQGTSIRAHIPTRKTTNLTLGE